MLDLLLLAIRLQSASTPPQPSGIPDIGMRCRIG